MRERRFLVLLFLVASSLLAGRASGRAPAENLFPRDTFYFVHVANLAEMRDRIASTSLGRMSQDDLFKLFFNAAATAFARRSSTLKYGSIRAILDHVSATHGELAIGYLKRPDVRGGMDIVYLFHYGDREERVREALDKRFGAFREAIGSHTESIDGTEMEIFSHTVESVEQTALVIFHRDQTVVVSTSLAAARGMLARWDGADVDDRSLAANPRYAEIAKRCQVKKDRPPDAMFFCEPVSMQDGIVARYDWRLEEIWHEFTKQSGVDGFSGLGASLTLDVGEFDAVVQAHALMENPRTGVLNLVSLGTGDVTPPRWVPDNVVNYATVHFDGQRAHDEFKKAYDHFNGDEAFDKNFKHGMEILPGVDLDEFQIDAFGGRASVASWYEKRSRQDTAQPSTSCPGQAYVVAFDLKKESEFAKSFKTFQSIKAQIEAGIVGGETDPPSHRTTEKTFRSHDYFRVDYSDASTIVPGGKSEFTPSPLITWGPRHCCFGIAGDVLLISNSETAFQQTLRAIDRPAEADALADSDEYKRVAAKIKRIARAGRPSAVVVVRSREMVRAYYDLLGRSELLGEPAKDDSIFSLAIRSLKDCPLPPLESIEKYFSPIGVVLSDEPTGFHLTAFVFKGE